MVRRNAFVTLLVIGLLTAAVLALIASAGTGDGDDDDRSVRGAGTTIVEGGTGPPSFTPMITKVAFYWREGAGHFECLALAPSADAGSPGSGNFDTNVMYVTGPITAAQTRGNTAVLEGSATVTGVGAGSNQPFTVTVTRGGPGATLVLEVSGLTFREILLKGQFRF
jgi:hypothetical protein